MEKSVAKKEFEKSHWKSLAKERKKTEKWVQITRKKKWKESPQKNHRKEQKNRKENHDENPWISCLWREEKTFNWNFNETIFVGLSLLLTRVNLSNRQPEQRQQQVNENEPNRIQQVKKEQQIHAIWYESLFIILNDVMTHHFDHFFY